MNIRGHIFFSQVWLHKWNLGWRSWSSTLLAVLALKKVSLWLNQMFLLYFYLFTPYACHFSFVNLLLENLFVAFYLSAFNCVFSSILLMASLDQPQFISFCHHRLCRVCSHLNLQFITEVILAKTSWVSFLWFHRCNHLCFKESYCFICSFPKRLFQREINTSWLLYFRIFRGKFVSVTISAVLSSVLW